MNNNNPDDCNKHCPKSGTPEANIHLPTALTGDTPSPGWSQQRRLLDIFLS